MRHQQFHRKFANSKPSNSEFESIFTSNDDEQIFLRTSNSIVDFLSDDESEPESNNDFKLDISFPLRRIVSEMLENFSRDEKLNSELEFPSSLFCHERKFVRQQAQQRNLRYQTVTRGAARFAVVSKLREECSSSRKVDSIRKLTFAARHEEILSELKNFLEICPVSNDDRSILQAKIQKMPNSLNDCFFCGLLREGNPLNKISNVKSRVPERRFLSRQFSNFALPIDFGENLNNFIDLLENNKIVFVNGGASIGKSIRICQTIHDEHFDRHWPVRIVHSCSNELSSFSLSSSLAAFDQPVDCFTFDNLFAEKNKSETNSLIAVTTHKFLLHTLIAGDSLLKSSLTHLIIDDVHKRSHDLDMLLAFLKDSMNKFRHFKLILVQTSIQFDTLIKYFGNVPNLTLEINPNFSTEIEEIFLDRILTEIRSFDQDKIFAIEKFGAELLEIWSRIAEDSSQRKSSPTRKISEPCRIFNLQLEENLSEIDRNLNELIRRCFCFGLIEDFQVLIDFLSKNPEKCNHQHPLTLVTPLMCAAAWSLKSHVERLLSFDRICVDLRAVNNFSPLDFARKHGTNEMIDFLEQNLKFESLLFEQILSLTERNANEIRSIETMKFYFQTRTAETVVDFSLILSIIEHVYRKRSDHILVFLPDFDSISTLAELFTEFNKTANFDLEIVKVLDFSARFHEVRRRFLILCDSRSETGLSFGSIGAVIDTGIVLDLFSSASSSKFVSKYSWINQTSGVERKFRATTNGVFYRIYPRTLLAEKITENVHSEMSRQPFLENILQAKLFAWTSCSLAEFMLKLPFPPPFGIVRAAVTQLKNLELLDRWEDILDLGVHCLALPIVDLPYAMMIVYAHLFKCLEPILVLVSILMIPEPVRNSFVESKFFAESKKKFGANRNSDHFVLYRIFDFWSKSAAKMKSSFLEEIDRLKTRLTKFVEGKNYAHYFVSNSSEKIDLNENCRCWFLVEAILVRCLPQNLIIHDERWFTTKFEPVEIDRFSSVEKLSTNDGIRFAVCDDLLRSDRSSFVGKIVTIVDPIVFLLFSSAQENFEFAENFLLQFKTKLDAALKRKLQSVGQENSTNDDFRSIEILLRVFSDASNSSGVCSF